MSITGREVSSSRGAVGGNYVAAGPVAERCLFRWVLLLSLVMVLGFGLAVFPDSAQAQVTSVPGKVRYLNTYAGGGTVRLAWGMPRGGLAPATLIQNFEVTYKAGTGAYGAWTAVPGGRSATSMTISGLSTSETYTFKVRPRNQRGTGPESDEVEAVWHTVPGKVMNLRGRLISRHALHLYSAGSLPPTPLGNRVILIWDRAHHGGTEAYDSLVYEVSQRAQGTASWSPWRSLIGMIETRTITGLENGLPYRFKVRARNWIGVGPESDVLTVTPRDKPSAVTDLAATAGDGQVTLNWTVPANNGAAITSYGYEKTTGNWPTVDISGCTHGTPGCLGVQIIPIPPEIMYRPVRLGSVTTNGTTASAVVRGLQNGTEYTFRIAAYNAAGVANRSNDATATPQRPRRQQEASPLTSSWTAPGSHDGSDFSFDLNFSENVAVGYASVRDHVVTASGGDVIRVRRLTPGSNQGWRITVRPEGNSDVSLSVTPGADCSEASVVCTNDGRSLSVGLSTLVAGPQNSAGQSGSDQSSGTALTASWSPPASHDGSVFSFDLNFSENVAVGYASVRDHVVSATGGDVIGARRLTPGSNQGWRITVRPDGGSDVSLSIASGLDCSDARAVCTNDGRSLSAGLTAGVRGN